MISIIIPAYNEAATIGLLIDRLNSVLFGRKHEIIIVDDSSSDGTPELVQAKGALLIQHPQRTYGDVSPALKIALGEIIVRLDADLEHDPADLPRMLSCLEQNRWDLVIGKRKEFSRRAEALLQWWYKFPVKDIFSGYLVFSRKLLPGIFQYQMTKLFWELPLYALKNGFPVGEVEVHTTKRKDRSRFGGEVRGGLRTLIFFRQCQKRIRY